jgi:hypothetical protein
MQTHQTPTSLHRFIQVMGTVALVAGTRALLAGAREVRPTGPIPAPVDSEYRFYAAWYPIVGLTLLRAARQPEVDPHVVRGLAGGMGLAATGRLLSIRVHGRPHRSQAVLLVVEALIACGVVPWHARQRSGNSSTSS